jgi:Arc/MetJ-type ribon-helix-helix transcriptional regulator
MPRISIEVSPEDMEFIELEVKQSAIASTSELVRIALKEYRRAQALDELDRLVDEALENDASTLVTPEYWERKKREFLARRQAAAK